jgi:16S rRNA (uracil1498-N3)-methyltransferase
MKRFYVEPGLLAGDAIAIEGALAHRLAKVLRLRAGDEIALFDGSGDDTVVRLNAADGRRILASVVERHPGPAESRTAVHLYQSVTKGDRFEWLLEKATEIGVARIVPLVAARAVVRTPAEGNRADRWRRIVIEAAEQCERSTVPIVGAPESLSGALASAPGVLLLPYEEAGEAAPNIAELLSQNIDELFARAAVSVFIGPEGGFEPAEVEAAREAGASIVTLGTRVLRSETAGLVAATLVMQALGELG